MAEVQLKDVEPMVVMSLAFTGPYDQTQEKLDEIMGWLLLVFIVFFIITSCAFLLWPMF